MPVIDDLEPCTAFPDVADTLRAVGWLGRSSDYVRGAVSSAFFDQLAALCKDPWQPHREAGMHHCELCQFHAAAFTGCLFVPHDGSLYVAPAGIVHYVSVHWYRPPEVFVDAVLACPPMRSTGYRQALLVNGGRRLIAGAGR
ncbi:hypothetical protein ACFJIW_09910 [Tahibacter sp. UC22_41]|uniref:DUF7919 family protein n=1 Tax=Tahibacter sp. UC22_41 TaxID=3350178 RepID=UPI0036DDF523